MFQNISPHRYDNTFASYHPALSDFLILIDDRQLLLKGHPGDYELPVLADLPDCGDSAVYLFSIDEHRFFYSPADPNALVHRGLAGGSTPGIAAGSAPVTNYASFSLVHEMSLREPGALGDQAVCFGAATAVQLSQWYSLHRFCGKCGVETKLSSTERAIICPKCGHVYYPRISPVVIIAITDGDRLLLTRYTKGYVKRHALVAGFVEIGETLEDAIRREVMEEVGLKVKNIRYCESQPWAFSSSLIAGFFADVDGSSEVRLNTDGKDELAEGVWIRREDLEIEDTTVSLTWDMVKRFKEGREPKVAGS